MAAACLTLLLAGMCVIHVHTLQYSDLELLGVQLCPTKNSCEQMGNADFSIRICECDHSCNSYGDCCIDGPISRSRRRNREICLPYGSDSLGAFVIGSCPSTYTGSAGVSSQCQNGNASDPLMSAPVTDTRNNRTYLNQFCAVCNDAFVASLQFWNVEMTCPDHDMTEDSEHSFQDLSFRSDLDRWGMLSEGQFVACEMTFAKPDYIQHGFRPCRANLISTCPSSYRRVPYIRACNTYTSVVMDKGSSLLYRNPHCAICNGVSTNDVECFRQNLLGRKKKPFSFALLLDVNRSDGDLVGKTQRCPNGQKWDPFFRKCRTLVCAIPGFTMVDGKCRKR